MQSEFSRGFFRVRRGRKAAGFSLAELMIALAIIAVLALVALLAYQEYVARAKAAEVLQDYGAVRTRVGVRLATASHLVEECDALKSALDNTYPLASKNVGLGY